MSKNVLSEHTEEAEEIKKLREIINNYNRIFQLSESSYRVYSVNNVTDQNVLEYLVLTDKNKDVRIHAINTLTDKEILTKIVLNNDSEKFLYQWVDSACIHCGDCTHGSPYDYDPCDKLSTMIEHKSDLRDIARERLTKL